MPDAGFEPRQALLLTRVFQFEYDRGRLPEARQAIEKALAIRQRLTPDNLQMGECPQNLGMVSYAQGNLAEAKRRSSSSHRHQGSASHPTAGSWP